MVEATPDKAAIHDASPHVLLVDDDTRIRTLLTKYLVQNGYRVTSAEHADDARAKMEGLQFDAMVLDIMMPGETGLEFAKSLRAASSDVPIIMLTARSETENRIEGLEAGADDYLPKPFEPRELLLRLNALVRRTASTAEGTGPEQIVFGPFTFSLLKLELKKRGEPVKLTEREKAILATFANKPNETVPRDDLCPPNTEVGERTIDVQINRLRRKIEAEPADPVWLQTVRGIGYKLSTD
ncbi:MAG: response regulator transcription factor [Pseudomonadota bacterium]